MRHQPPKVQARGHDPLVFLLTASLVPFEPIPALLRLLQLEETPRPAEDWREETIAFEEIHAVVDLDIVSSCQPSRVAARGITSDGGTEPREVRQPRQLSCYSCHRPFNDAHRSHREWQSASEDSRVASA